MSPSAAILVRLMGHETWSSPSTVSVLLQAVSSGRWYRDTDSITGPVLLIAWELPHCLVRAICAKAMCFGRSVGKAVSVGCSRKRTFHIHGRYNIGKKILISFQDSFGILGNSTEKCQSQEKKVLTASFLQVYQRQQ